MLSYSSTKYNLIFASLILYYIIIFLNIFNLKNYNESDNNEQSSIINLLLQFRTDIKMFHWQTDSFAYHKISDELLSSIDGLSDKFVEALSGLLNIRPSMRLRDATHPCPKVNCSIMVRNVDLDLFLNELDEVSDVLRNATKIVKFSEIANIRDEILGEIDKAKYLMTFK